MVMRKIMMPLYRLNPIYCLGFLWGVAKNSKRCCVLLWIVAIVPASSWLIWHIIATWDWIADAGSFVLSFFHRSPDKSDREMLEELYGFAVEIDADADSLKLLKGMIDNLDMGIDDDNLKAIKSIDSNRANTFSHEQGHTIVTIGVCVAATVMIFYWHNTYEPKPEVATEMPVVLDTFDRVDSQPLAEGESKDYNNNIYVDQGYDNVCAGGSPPRYDETCIPAITLLEGHNSIQAANDVPKTGTVFYSNYFYNTAQEAHNAANVGDTIGFFNGGHIVNGLPCKINNEEHQTIICDEDGKPRFRIYVGQDGPVMEQIKEAGE